MTRPTTPSPSSCLHEHESMRRPLRISIENPFSDSTKQFESPSCFAGHIAVPSLDYTYCFGRNPSNDDKSTTDAGEYWRLRTLIAPDSEAGSPRPRRQIRSLAKSVKTIYGKSDDMRTKDSENAVGTACFCRSDDEKGISTCPHGNESATTVSTANPGRRPQNAWSYLPREIQSKILGFLSGRDMRKMSLVSKRLALITRDHPSWQRNVLMEYGFKYDNYSLYTGNTDWYRIYSKVSAFIRRLRKGQPRMQMFDRVLNPIAVPNYEGSMALTMDNDIFLWENGETIQAVDLQSGKELFRVMVSEVRTAASKPCIISTKTNIFFHINGRIHVFCGKTGDKVKELSIPDEVGPRLSAEFCLDLSMRNNQLTFLTSKSLHVWDSISLNYLYKIEHYEQSNWLSGSGELDFLWCGFSLERSRGDRSPGSPEVYLSQHRRSRQIATWMKMESSDIVLHNLEDASRHGCLKGNDGPLARVRHVQNTNNISNYYISSLSVSGTISIWDSSVRGFVCISKLHTNNPRAFRFAMTTSHMFLMSDDEASACNKVNMWRFNQPSRDEVARYLDHKSKETVSMRTSEVGGMEIEGMNVFSGMRTCRLSRHVFFSDIIDNRFLGLWHSVFREGTTTISLSQSNWEVYDSLQIPVEQSPVSAGGLRRSTRSRSVCEMSQPMAFRQQREQPQSRRGSCDARTPTICPVLEPEASSSENVLAQEEASLLNRRCFRMLHRADTWSMLDWKSLSVLTDGSLMVYDFASSP
eukprot:Selendium_serpulae@DN6342_c1_g3_i4.p1